MVDKNNASVYYWFVVSDYWTVVMFMIMKVRRTQEWDIPDLHTRLQKAAGESNKSITQICKEAELSTAFWYELAKGRKNSISFESLERLCKALGLTIKSVGISLEGEYASDEPTETNKNNQADTKNNKND